MRKYIFVLLTQILAVSVLNAQSVQRVRVMEYKGDKAKTPLANVEVIVGNASAAMTDHNGECLLNFRTLKAGDKVNIRSISKPGYEILSEDRLCHWVVTRDAVDERVIVMASSKRIIKEREKYMRTAEKAIADNMARRRAVVSQQVETTQITMSEYVKRQKEIEDEYVEQLDAIRDLIDRVVHTDMSEIATSENEIMNLIKQGDVDGALVEYEKLNLLGTYRSSVEDGRKLMEASKWIESELRKSDEYRYSMYMSIRRQNDLYRIVGGKENIEAGFKLWHDFAHIDTTYALPLLGYSQYCERSNRIDEALDAVKYCFNSTDTVMQMRAALLYMQLLSKQNHYDEIVPRLERAYHYMDSVRIVRDEDSQFLHERAYALYLLCKSYSYLREVEKGQHIRQVMLDVNQQAYEWDKSNLEQKRKYVNALYAAHHSVNLLDSRGLDGGWTVESIETLKKSDFLNQAIALQEELYRLHPIREAGMLAFLHTEKANILANIAKLQQDSVLYDMAEAEFGKTFDLYKEAYSHNSKAYAHFLAIAYLRYERFLLISSRLESKEQALTLLQKAKDYEEEDNEYNPTSSRITYINVLAGVAVVCEKYKDYEFAEHHYLEAESLLAPLYEKYPKTYWRFVYNIYMGLRNIYGANAMNDVAKFEKMEEKIDAHKEEYAILNSTDR